MSHRFSFNSPRTLSIYLFERASETQKKDDDVFDADVENPQTPGRVLRRRERRCPAGRRPQRVLRRAGSKPRAGWDDIRTDSRTSPTHSLTHPLTHSLTQFIARHFNRRFSTAIIEDVAITEHLDGCGGSFTALVRVVLYSGTSAAVRVSHSDLFGHPSAVRQKVFLSDKKLVVHTLPHSYSLQLTHLLTHFLPSLTGEGHDEAGVHERDDRSRAPHPRGGPYR